MKKRGKRAVAMLAWHKHQQFMTNIPSGSGRLQLEAAKAQGGEANRRRNRPLIESDDLEGHPPLIRVIRPADPDWPKEPLEVVN
jgi:hypothetical protein